MVLSIICPKYNLVIGSNFIKESADVELMGLIIDNKLSFENISQNYAKKRHSNSMHSGK